MAYCSRVLICGYYQYFRNPDSAFSEAGASSDTANIVFRLAADRTDACEFSRLENMYGIRISSSQERLSSILNCNPSSIIKFISCKVLFINKLSLLNAPFVIIGTNVPDQFAPFMLFQLSLCAMRYNKIGRIPFILFSGIKQK